MKKYQLSIKKKTFTAFKKIFTKRARNTNFSNYKNQENKYKYSFLCKLKKN